jgi:ABC-2 type transport system ATP-binding protein
MDEAQYLADRVAVISAGRIVARGDPATLADRELAKARIRYRVPGGATPPAALAGATADGFTEFSPDGRRHQSVHGRIPRRQSLA